MSDASSGPRCLFFFFFNDTATTEIYTLSLHDALPICSCSARRWARCTAGYGARCTRSEEHTSELQSHSFISYAVFCLKKKKTSTERIQSTHTSDLLRRLLYTHTD